MAKGNRSIRGETLTFNGVTHRILEWAKIIGWSPETIRRRAKNSTLSIGQILSPKKLSRMELGHSTTWKYPIGTKTYDAWKKMRLRCSSNSENQDRKNYFERGIRVCERWANNYDAFYEDMGESPKGTSLDRIDNNKNYEASNCRWATMKQQQRNKRNNVLIEFKGQIKTVAEWAEITGIEVSIIGKRFKKGYDPEKVFSKERVNKCKHASISSYEYGCRCDECRNFMKLYRAKLKLRQGEQNVNRSR